MKYSETHEWIDVKDGVGTVGVSDYAQKELGDIVYAELPKIGSIVKVGDEVAVLESTKAAADVYAPVSGTIVEINASVSSHSELVNQSPEKDGWLFRIQLNTPQELDKLMDMKEYHTKFN
jgi:glycine cleavage system H protein